MSAKGMLVSVIATQIADAVAKDETPEEGGCDISAGLFGPNMSNWIRDLANQLSQDFAPIDMVLHCPACGLQHIDAPDTEPSAHPDGRESKWDNPPHRSHLCHGCGHIWRPADVPTNGVAAVKTRGKNDSPIVKFTQNAKVPAGWHISLSADGLLLVVAPKDGPGGITLPSSDNGQLPARILRALALTLLNESNKTSCNAEFNAAINFAIEQGLEASTFLTSWREGDTSEWPEFKVN